jgi:hypothetical protein
MRSPQSDWSRVVAISRSGARLALGSTFRNSTALMITGGLAFTGSRPRSRSAADFIVRFAPLALSPKGAPSVRRPTSGSLTREAQRSRMKLAKSTSLRKADRRANVVLLMRGRASCNVGTRLAIRRRRPSPHGGERALLFRQSHARFPR